MFRKSYLAALALLPLLTACSTPASNISMMPEPQLAQDPSDTQLVSSIQSYLEEQNGPKNSQYEYVRLDLNDDGLREGLVLFNLPHSYWCGWSGCTMAIFEAGDNSFTLLSQTTRIRGPLFVGRTKTNGWEDIVVRLSGTENPDRNVVLRYDGKIYPENPATSEDAFFDLASLEATRIFP